MLALRSMNRCRGVVAAAVAVVVVVAASKPESASGSSVGQATEAAAKVTTLAFGSWTDGSMSCSARYACRRRIETMASRQPEIPLYHK
jgi:hypothetical protein